MKESALSDKIEFKDNASEEQGYTSKELIEASYQVNQYLNTLGLPNSKWSGRTFVKKLSEMPTCTGVKKKACDIWLREDAGLKTIIHEHLHARSSSWMDKKMRKHRGFEEGACELLAEEICEQNGIDYRKTYDRYVSPLRKFNSILKKYDNDYEFAIELFNVEMDQREQWLIDLATKQGIVKSFRLKRLIRKVSKESEK